LEPVCVDRLIRWATESRRLYHHAANAAPAIPASIPYRFFVIVLSSRVGRWGDVEQYQDHMPGRSERVVLRIRGALDGDSCRAVRAAMDRGETETAEVLAGDTAIVDNARRATYVAADEETLSRLSSCLDAQRDTVAAFFDARVVAREGAGLVRYGAGGFYRPHRDRADMASWPAASRRCITLILFLNADFDGGLLRLLPDDDEDVDVVPEEGMLVAFPSETAHEVTTITRGTRDVVVDWFMD
jgi:predicted 2-oxoglutarate/Fe(II)-dependent dioxygenase YbiX